MYCLRWWGYVECRMQMPEYNQHHITRDHRPFTPLPFAPLSPRCPKSMSRIQLFFHTTSTTKCDLSKQSVGRIYCIKLLFCLVRRNFWMWWTVCDLVQPVGSCVPNIAEHFIFPLLTFIFWVWRGSSHVCWPGPCQPSRDSSVCVYVRMRHYSSLTFTAGLQQIL